MRSLALSSTMLAFTVLAGLAGTPVLAQTAVPTNAQGVPRGTDPVTGARPGNDVGTGMSMPMGTRASNIDAGDTRSTIAPNLPSPSLGPDSSPADYLRAAQASLQAGRTGEAQQSLEMAQTRLLDRSVPTGPDQQSKRQPRGDTDFAGLAGAGCARSGAGHAVHSGGYPGGDRVDAIGPYACLPRHNRPE